MMSRPYLRYREKFGVLFIMFMSLVSGLLILQHFKNNNYKSAQWTGERCSSELASVKYQLNVVTEYKNKLDKLVTETQKSHEADKARFKDIMDSCVAMKQQSIICQSQFEDLQSECKKVRENYDKVLKDLKTSIVS